MRGKYTSRMLWADVPPEQRETAAGDAKTLLKFAQRRSTMGDSMISDLMVPWVRGQIKTHRRADQGEACPMATRQAFDRDKQVWMYRPCANYPRPGETFCWRHKPDQ